MKKSISMLAIAVSAMCLCGGCVVGRRTIDIESIHAKEFADAKANIKPGEDRVRISLTVVDKRVFQDSPRDPSIPSMGGKNGNEACLIGRQRNTYGMAMGDVAASNGYTVAEHIGKLVEEAFIKAGYEVVRPGSVEDGVIPVEVVIYQFWGWMTPGFWTLTLSARSDIKVAISGGVCCGSVSSLVETNKNAMAAGDAAWLASFARNADDLVADLVAKLKKHHPSGLQPQMVE